MFFFSLLSKLFNKVSSLHVGPATKPCLLITESATCTPVFCHRQLPHHLVQKCLRRPANCPGTPDSRWNCSSTFRPSDIHDAFTTKPLPWDVQVNPQVGPYRHPNHKSCLTRTQCPSPPSQVRVQGSRGRQGFRQKPSWSLRQGLRKLFTSLGCCPRSTSGWCSAQEGYLPTSQCPYISPTPVIGAFKTPLMLILIFRSTIPIVIIKLSCID
jgi:hypothetical protein